MNLKVREIGNTCQNHFSKLANLNIKQYSKAIYVNDCNASNKILSAKNTLECKNLGKLIAGYEQAKWEEVAKSRC